MNDSEFRRWASKIDYDEKSGCWLWRRVKSESRYGCFRIGGRQRPAHVVSFVHFKGAMPPGLQADHLCRVRRCVNPYHLEAVTPRVNTLRGVGACGRNARKTTCPYGHPLVVVSSTPRQRRCLECKSTTTPEERANLRRRAQQRAKEPWCPDIPGWSPRG